MTNSSLNVADLDGSNGFVINGTDTAGFAGYSVSSAGDINGDGIDDLIIGAPGDVVAYSFGKTYVVFGGTDVGSTGSIDLDSLDGTNGFVLNGTTEGESLGVCVSDAGDINGDGFADLIIGVRGPYFLPGSERNYVVFGGTDVGSTGNIDLDSLDGTNGFVLNSNASGTRDYAVSSAGDINGDGVDDLIIGVPGPWIYGSSGFTYVVFGDTTVGADGNFNLSDLNGSNGFRITGNRGDSIGTSVSSAGDINGDGIDDLIIGASYDDGSDGNYFAGSSYVVFGGTNVGTGGSLNLSDLDGSNGFVLNGVNQEDESGTSVSSAGDINGDGIDDLIIGAPEADANGNDSGASYVVFGATNVGNSGSIELSTLDGSNGFVINGLAGERAGFSVSNAGDINSDGIDDLIIGAPGSFASNTSGASYVVFGGTDVGASGSIDLSTLDGSNGFVINGLAVNDSTGFSVSGAGDVNGDGIDDLIIGAPYASVNGSGASYVVFGSATVTLPVLTQMGTRNADTLEGSNGSDRLFGRRGDDLLTGGLNSDLLCGNWGNDLLTGGGGSDRFVLRAGQGTDTITDFEDGQDSLILTRGLTFGQLEIGQSNSDTLISLNSTGEVLATLTGVSANLITASDFFTI